MQDLKTLAAIEIWKKVSYIFILSHTQIKKKLTHLTAELSTVSAGAYLQYINRQMLGQAEPSVAKMQQLEIPTRGSQSFSVQKADKRKGGGGWMATSRHRYSYYINSIVIDNWLLDPVNRLTAAIWLFIRILVLVTLL